MVCLDCVKIKPTHWQVGKGQVCTKRLSHAINLLTCSEKVRGSLMFSSTPPPYLLLQTLPLSPEAVILNNYLGTLQKC